MGNGKELQKLLGNLQVSVTHLAKTTGISPNTLYAIIKRDSNISTSTMRKIADALNMPVNELAIALSSKVARTKQEENPYIINQEINETGTYSLVDKLNRATIQYNDQICILREKEDRLRTITLQKQNIEVEIRNLEYDIMKIQTDLKNRSIELDLLRSKIKE